VPETQEGSSFTAATAHRRSSYERRCQTPSHISFDCYSWGRTRHVEGREATFEDYRLAWEKRTLRDGDVSTEPGQVQRTLTSVLSSSSNYAAVSAYRIQRYK
jgi:hypothetical protein